MYQPEKRKRERERERENLVCMENQSLINGAYVIYSTITQKKNVNHAAGYGKTDIKRQIYVFIFTTLSRETQASIKVALEIKFKIKIAIQQIQIKTKIQSIC